jgi:plasmid replication initiation protein
MSKTDSNTLDLIPSETVSPELRHRIAAASNSLLTRIGTLSAPEQRIVLTVISFLEDKRRDEKSMKQIDVAYEWPVKEFIEFAELPYTGKNRTRDFVGALMQLRSRPLLIEDGDSIVVTGWFSSARVPRYGRKVTFTFDPLLRNHLLGLRRDFSKLQLEQVLKFRKDYTIPLYWMLTRIDETGPKLGRRVKAGDPRRWYVHVELRELRKALGLYQRSYRGSKTIDVYKRWPDIRRYVLDPAVQEFDEKSEYTVSYEAVRAGSGKTSPVIGVTFHVTTPESVIADRQNKRDSITTGRARGEQAFRDQWHAVLEKILHRLYTLPEDQQPTVLMNLIVSLEGENIQRMQKRGRTPEDGEPGLQWSDLMKKVSRGAMLDKLGGYIEFWDRTGRDVDPAAYEELK